MYVLGQLFQLISHGALTTLVLRLDPSRCCPIVGCQDGVDLLDQTEHRSAQILEGGLKLREELRYVLRIVLIPLRSLIHRSVVAFFRPVHQISAFTDLAKAACSSATELGAIGFFSSTSSKLLWYELSG